MESINSALRENSASLANPSRIHIVANGCQENFMDAALLKRFLSEKHGFLFCENVAEADIILVMGCSVTQHMEDESRDIISHFREHKRPGARLFTLGCITKYRPELKNDGMEAFLPVAEIESLLRMDENAKQMAVNAPYYNAAFVDDLLKNRKPKVFKNYVDINKAASRNGHFSAGFNVLFGVLNKYKGFIESRLNVFNENTHSIKISTGCAGSCSYCSVRIARGKVKSKPIDDVLAEFERGLRSGYRYFTILGTDIGDYGRDLGLDLMDLLQAVTSAKGEYRLKLRNLNPRWLIPNHTRLFKLLEDRRIVYIQSPVQSGSDRILELMKRGYRAQDFIRAADEIHRRFPEVVLRTQMIAGFPSETEEEFQKSVTVIDTGIFDYVDVFRYTPRDHTEAASIEPKVPFDEIMRRYRKLFFKSLFRQPLRKMQAIRRLNHH